MKRSDELLVKASPGTHVTVLSIHDNPPAVTVKKGDEEWIFRPEELITVEDFERQKKEKETEKLKSKYSDILSVYADGDTHINLASKLHILPIVAWGKLKAVKNHGLI